MRRQVTHVVFYCRTYKPKNVPSPIYWCSLRVLDTKAFETKLSQACHIALDDDVVAFLRKTKVYKYFFCTLLHMRVLYYVFVVVRTVFVVLL
jgi:hypothetical protein